MAQRASRKLGIRGGRPVGPSPGRPSFARLSYAPPTGPFNPSVRTLLTGALDGHGQGWPIFSGLRNRRTGSSGVPRSRLERGNDVVCDRLGQAHPGLVRLWRMLQHLLVVVQRSSNDSLDRYPLLVHRHDPTVCTIRAVDRPPGRAGRGWETITSVNPVEQVATRAPDLRRRQSAWSAGGRTNHGMGRSTPGLGCLDLHPVGCLQKGSRQHRLR
jgi:hypothetical protein